MHALLLSLILAAPPSPAGPVDPKKFAGVSRAASLFVSAIGDPAASSAERLRRRDELEREAEKLEHAPLSPREKYLYDLYSTAAAEYGDAMKRRASGEISSGELDASTQEVVGYLRQAEEILAPPHEAAAPRVAPPHEAAAPQAAAPAKAPAPTLAPPPAAAAPPSAPQPPAPAPPEPAEAMRYSGIPQELSIDLPLDSIRSAVNRVRVEKHPARVAPCRLMAKIEVPASAGSGVVAIQGHNFFYGGAEELAKFETVAARGDTFLRRGRSRDTLSGEAWRCR